MPTVGHLEGPLRPAVTSRRCSAEQGCDCGARVVVSRGVDTGRATDQALWRHVGHAHRDFFVQSFRSLPRTTLSMEDRMDVGNVSTVTLPDGDIFGYACQSGHIQKYHLTFANQAGVNTHINLPRNGPSGSSSVAAVLGLDANGAPARHVFYRQGGNNSIWYVLDQPAAEDRRIRLRRQRSAQARSGHRHSPAPSAQSATATASSWWASPTRLPTRASRS